MNRSPTRVHARASTGSSESSSHFRTGVISTSCLWRCSIFFLTILRRYLARQQFWAWTHRFTDAQRHRRTEAWVYGCTEAWMYGCTEAWMYGCTEAWKHGCMDARLHRGTHARMYGGARMHGSMEAWMHECWYACIRFFLTILPRYTFAYYLLGWGA